MLDVNEFLQPISEQSECGEYLLYDNIYDQLREYIREDDPQLSQGVWQIDVKKANWPKAIELICDLLKNRTKDLQLLAWLTEALLASEGLPGMITGINITIEVSKKFWEDMYPIKNAGSRRLMPFFYMADKINEKLAMIPLTEPIGEENKFYTLADLLTAQHNFKIRNFSGLTIRTVKKILQATSYDFLHAQQENTANSIVVINQLAKFLEEKYNSEAPSFANILNNLNAIKRVTDQALEKVKPPKIIVRKEAETDAPKEQIPTEDKNNSEEEQAKPPQDTEPTIEHAYEVLKGIANFLQRKQPQSPASILIKIAATIGEKSFQELLDLNMQSGTSVINTISELYKILNVDTKKGESAQTDGNDSQGMV